MVGKGGGNFYVVILAVANIPMHEAATTGQFILFAASLAAMFVFQKNKLKSFRNYFSNCLRVFLLIVLPLLVIAAIIEGLLMFVWPWLNLYILFDN